MRQRLAVGIAVGLLVLVIFAATPAAALQTTPTDITNAPGFDSVIDGLVQILEGIISGLQSLV